MWRPDRRGHGCTPDVPGPITYDNMADDTIEFLEAAVGEPAHLIGYSDGAMVGLLVALRRPDLVRKLVLMGLYVNRDGEVEWFGRYVRDATAADVPESIRRGYEERSPDGPEHFEVVAEKILHLWSTEPDLPVDTLRGLAVPTLLLQGDDDIVTLEHGVAMARGSPTRSSRSCPARATPCPTRSPRSWRSCSSTSSPTSRCASCSPPRPWESDSVTCPACGHENREGARFCDACGTALPVAAGDSVPAAAETVDGGRYEIGRLIGEGRASACTSRSTPGSIARSRSRSCVPSVSTAAGVVEADRAHECDRNLAIQPRVPPRRTRTSASPPR